MNKYILCVLDRRNKTEEELEINAAAAYAAYADAIYAADADAIYAAAAYAAYNKSADVEYWLNEYFEATGENREEYEKAIKEKR